MTITTSRAKAKRQRLVSTSVTCPLRDALDTFAGLYPATTGYVMSPRAAHWIRWHEEAWRTVDRDSTVERVLDCRDFDAIFEARLLSGDSTLAELRWIHTAAGSGPAITVAAEPIDDGDVAPSDRPLAPETLGDDDGAQQLLLWGEATGRPGPDGWVEMADARIGGFWVPYRKPLKEHRRLVFEVLEFVETDQHGNCFVTDELIVGLMDIEPAEPRVHASEAPA